MSSVENQQRLVLRGYVIQWLTVWIPPALIISLIYTLAVRRRIDVDSLRSHIDWQLTTCIVTVVALGLAYILLIVGLSGVNTDAPLSIVATFVLVGGATAFPAWLIYRLVWGSLNFSKRAPMTRLLP